MTTQQSESIQRNFLLLVNEAISAMKAQAVAKDGLVETFLNDGEAFVLVYCAFSFFIAADSHLAPQLSTLNGTLAAELTRTITYYADRGHVGKRPFTQDERTSFAQAIYGQVYAGMASYQPVLQKDIRQIAHRQTIIFAETSRHFLSRYITEPPARERVSGHFAAYAEVVDRVIDGVTHCLRTS